MAAKNPKRQLAKLLIHAWQHSIHGFQHYDFAAQPIPYAAKFQTDVASADNGQLFWHRRISDRGIAVANQVAIFFDSSHTGWPRAGCQNNVFGFEKDCFIPRLNQNTMGVLKLPSTLVGRDFILLEQQINSAGERLDNLVLAFHHGG